ncbi:MAG: imidazolonepropionase [Bacteroidota bacterium]
MPQHLIGPFTQIVTLEGLPLRGPLFDSQLVVIEWGGILIDEQGKVVATGSFDELAKQVAGSGASITELSEALVAIPGLVDAHTHLCFAGSRARDFAMRNAGSSYLEIARAGGGIWDSVTETRLATPDELVELTRLRLLLHLAGGVTTCEVKSGYGLSVEEELKQLLAIKNASEKVVVDVIPTCLAAHVLPRDFGGNHAAYLAYLQNELFPQLAGLTERIDIFVEEEAFTPELAKKYLLAAQKKGFKLTVHADQFSSGGSEVAVVVGAQSADHLEASGEREIALLAQSDTVAVALPGASLGLGCAFTPARKLLDAGAILAIASDWNPGSAPMGDLLTQASILATFEKMSNAEVLAGMTFRAAKALGKTNVGRLAKGYKADIVAYATNDYREITYQQGQLTPSKIWKNGQEYELYD